MKRPRVIVPVEFIVPKWTKYIYWYGQGSYDFVVSDKAPVKDCFGMLKPPEGANIADAKFNIRKTKTKVTL